MTISDIRAALFDMQDREYRNFQSRLIPTVPKETVIGVRTPELRKFAKQLVKAEGAEAFLADLPHKYFDENQLHAFIISDISDFDICIKELYRFLPYVDNWATCDQMSPKAFKKHHAELIDIVMGFLDTGETYTIRFGIGVLMTHFLDEDFKPEYPQAVAGLRSEEYYINMMIAWYFATALAKKYDEVLPYITEYRLNAWTHNKAIQKALESYRITPEQKEYLRGFKIKKIKFSA